MRKRREGRAAPHVSLPQTASGTGSSRQDPASLPVTACHCARRQSPRPLIRVTAPGGPPEREPQRGMTGPSHPQHLSALPGNGRPSWLPQDGDLRCPGTKPCVKGSSHFASSLLKVDVTLSISGGCPSQPCPQGSLLWSSLLERTSARLRSPPPHPWGKLLALGCLSHPQLPEGRGDRRVHGGGWFAGGVMT